MSNVLRTLLYVFNMVNLYYGKIFFFEYKAFLWINFFKSISSKEFSK